ncbi:MAG: protein phosphatase 2C domain-containing protein [Tannerella sp.]|jgi:protein phosphatase|nr:protein phosphatase 2C domain-containing protein [Tannerella sp.]
MITTINIYEFSDKGIRENNEDSVASVNKNYFIVCDGMGGHGHGEIASQTVAESLCAFFKALTFSVEKSNLQAALDYAVKRLDKQDDEYVDAERKMGTTVVLAALAESSVLVGHVGDSRLYHIRQSEGLLFRTKDHSQVQEWVDAEIITEEEARTHPKKNLLSRCVQPHPAKPVVMEIDELEDIQTGDYLFLCTDGVTDAMTDEEIVATLSDYYISDEDKINRIKEACAARSKDNYSGFLLKLEAEVVSIIQQNEAEVEVKENPIKVKQDFIPRIQHDNKTSAEQHSGKEPPKISVKGRIKNVIDIFCRICTIAFFICIIVWFRSCGKDEAKDINVPVYQQQNPDTIESDTGGDAKPAEELAAEPVAEPKDSTQTKETEKLEEI